MLRTALLSLTLTLPLAAATPVGEEEVLGKTKSEWMKMFLADAGTVKQRSVALFALETLGPKSEGVLPTMLDVLKKHKDDKAKETSAEIRREVALTLGRMGEDAKNTIRPLAAALRDDPAETVREAAAKALGSMVPHSRIVVADLADALQDKHAGTRAAAAETLKDLGKESISVVPKLIEALKPGKDKQADPFARIYVTHLLGRLGKDGAVAEKTLLAVVTDREEHVKVREAAAEAVGRLAAELENAVPALEQVIKDAKADLSVRLAALVAFGKIGPETKVAWPTVKYVLHEKKGDSNLRTQAVRHAGTLGKEEAEVIAELKIVCVKDDNIEVRLAAIQELGAQGPIAKDAEATLQSLASNDARPSIREAAAAALKKIRTAPKEKE
jgi:HEAT repeat protein